MATTDELSDFVKQALAAGVSRDAIRDVLLKGGWPVEDVRTALRGYAEVSFPIPVPAPKPALDARDAFIYLVLFSTLYLSAYNLGALVFRFIEMAFPDTAGGIDPPYVRQAIRWSLASLLVAFPVFLYVSRVATRGIRQHPARRTSKVRRWLTYLTLFVSTSVLVGDLIALVFNLLGGELTIRFVLKVLTVAAIAGGVCAYYVWDLREETQASTA
jgi:hypothetical protein